MVRSKTSVFVSIEKTKKIDKLDGFFVYHTFLYRDLAFGCNLSSWKELLVFEIVFRFLKVPIKNDWIYFFPSFKMKKPNLRSWKLNGSNQKMFEFWFFLIFILKHCLKLKFKDKMHVQTMRAIENISQRYLFFFN